MGARLFLGIIITRTGATPTWSGCLYFKEKVPINVFEKKKNFRYFRGTSAKGRMGKLKHHCTFSFKERMQMEYIMKKS